MIMILIKCKLIRPIALTLAAALIILTATGCSQGVSGWGHADDRLIWQIMVEQIVGPQHRDIAMNVFTSLKVVKGLAANQFRITHGTNSSTITYGRYSSIDDPNAQKALKLIKFLVVATDGGRPFLDAHLEPVPTPDPPVPEKWLLKNVLGVWTLEIAKYHGKGRKRNAVALVKTLRGSGEQAFVDHGLTSSIVTIGIFGANAVQQTVRRAIVGPPRARDPKLIELLKKYPDYLINGRYAKFTTTDGAGKKSSKRILSRLLRIPEHQQMP